MTDFAAARQNMVLSQLAPSRVTEKSILRAMGAIPRERFVPKSAAAAAYVDEDVRIAPRRYLMEPVVFARLLQEAAIAKSDIVLDVGCGSGYSTAVLAQLAGTVVALESDEELANKAVATLAELGVVNAAVIVGDLAAGRSDQGPYDVILLNGAVSQVPAKLLGQLAEGGRLLAVVGEGLSAKATLYLRRAGVVGARPLFDAAVPPLPSLAVRPQFVF
ncbi:MAG: protein-L-isoaspartate O-methyltransferase [Alphaproteobacteria bacterium]|nr:protein-L-isoaspartate O-methyltransferase [Alphaproteobacteria bacterium]